jgi:hypothetical protein
MFGRRDYINPKSPLASFNLRIEENQRTGGKKKNPIPKGSHLSGGKPPVIF